jgi:hypothetical protein
MQDPDHHERIVRKATWLALLAGFVASTLAVVFVNEDFLQNTGMMMLASGAIVGGTVTMPLFWRWLVPAQGGFGIVRSVIAGGLSAILASMLMWPVAVSLLMGDGLDADISMIGAIRSGAAISLYFAVLTNIFVGWITIPLGMVASVLVTLWARRRMRPA